MVNCPFWRDYIRKEAYSDIEELRDIAAETFEEHCEMAREDLDIDLVAVQKELAEKMGITLYEDVAQDVLMKFYESAARSPKIIVSFKEKDGSVTNSAGNLFH